MLHSTAVTVPSSVPSTTATTVPVPVALPVALPVAVAVAVGEKRKRNLLSGEILRESTIVISTAEQGQGQGQEFPTPIKGGKARRSSNVSYALLRRTLLHYKMRYGDMEVPALFRVPSESNDWPVEMLGMNLGKVVQSVRGGKRKINKKDDLISIGFCYSIPEYRFELIKSALLEYRAVHHNLMVPRNFIIPNTTDYSEAVWGMTLGSTVTNIRSGISSYNDKRWELENIGFIYYPKEIKEKIFRECLERYRVLNNNYNVPKDFIVPHGDLWHPRLWGMELGKMVINERRRKREGFEFLSISHMKPDYETVIDLVNIYINMFHRDVHRDFVINPKNDYWPYRYDIFESYHKETHGIKLGDIIHRIYTGTKWPEKKVEFRKFLDGKARYEAVPYNAPPLKCITCITHINSILSTLTIED